MIKTFRAKSIQQALELVRAELGPDASVLHTRRLNTGMVSRWVRGTEIEVAATVAAAADGATASATLPTERPSPPSTEESAPPTPAVRFDHSDQYRRQLAHASAGVPLQSSAAIPRETAREPEPAPSRLFDAFATLVDADVEEVVCRDLLGALRSAGGDAIADAGLLRETLASLIAEELRVSGPIQTQVQQAESEGPRLAALVGPTGVGKTTSIAKLAANFRLKQQLRVGLITVDTYRVAAVDQLRTYADIIDLPMEVVATPREMRRAREKFADLDLVLLDTAGRSPRDAVRLQELQSILAEARPDEVHLVLSTTASPRSLVGTVEQFASVGVTSLLLTKLDEADGLGRLLSVTRESGLPISYLTNGQNVPDDIAVAEAKGLADSILTPATPAKRTGGDL